MHTFYGTFTNLNEPSIGLSLSSMFKSVPYIRIIIFVYKITKPPVLISQLSGQKHSCLIILLPCLR